MEENNKQLLIRDICARLPYGVYVKFKQYNEPLCLSVKDALVIYNGGEIINDLQYLYLRPMSSMTEEEYNSIDWEGCRHIIYYDKNGFRFVKIDSFTTPVLDYLNAHHFDFHYLIEKGLALEAPEEMYKAE